MRVLVAAPGACAWSRVVAEPGSRSAGGRPARGLALTPVSSDAGSTLRRWLDDAGDPASADGTPSRSDGLVVPLQTVIIGALLAVVAVLAAALRLHSPVRLPRHQGRPAARRRRPA